MTSPDEPATHIAVFGDIHGRVALMFILSYLWEKTTGKELTSILQVGDMGAYPDISRLDRATLRHAQRDPDELDFHKYCFRSPEGERYAGHPETKRAYFIRGNHEDFDYLEGFHRPTAIDPWEKIWYLPDQSLLELPKEGGQTLTVAGYGGIHPRQDSSPMNAHFKKPPSKHKASSKHKQSDKWKKYFCPEEVGYAFMNTGPIDILLTHAGPECDELPQGSSALAHLATRIQPKFHFFGHHHRIIDIPDGLGGSRLIGLEHLDFTHQGQLQDCAWGILSLQREEANFTFASHETMPWLYQIRRKHYRKLFRDVSQHGRQLV